MTTDHPAPPPTAYTDVAALADRLGITRATLRQHIAAQVTWLPRPTKLGGAWVWLTSDLEGIEERRRRPGNPNWTKRTAGQPVVDQVPASATTTNATPAADVVAEDDGFWDDDEDTPTA